MCDFAVPSEKLAISSYERLDAHLYTKYTMNELQDCLEIIERFERESYSPQLGEITEKQRDLYKILGYDHPNPSLC